MKIAGKHIAFRFLWLCMLLQIFNCSLDCQEYRRANFSHSKYYYVHQESIIESVVDFVFKNDDPSSNCKKKHSRTHELAFVEHMDEFTAPNSKLSPEPAVFHSFSGYYPQEERCSLQHIPDLSSPPPKV